MSDSVEYACGYSDGRSGRSVKGNAHLIRPADYLAGYTAGAAARRG